MSGLRAYLLVMYVKRLYFYETICGSDMRVTIKKVNYKVFLQSTVLLSYTAAWRDTYGTLLGYHKQEVTSKIKLLIFLIGSLSLLLQNFIFSSPNLHLNRYYT